jgi:FtsH-binding integral membrane protein
MAQARAAAQPARTSSQARVNRFVAHVFLLMSVGLAVTALVAGWAGGNLQFLLRINLNPWISFGLFILQIVIVAALSAAVMRMSTGAALLLFLLYSAMTGLTISSIFLVYTQESIAYVFWITAGTFLITSLFGLLLKRDLTGAGSVLFMLLVGWTFAWALSWMFPYSSFSWWLTFLGIALFVGLTAHDAQRMREIGLQLGDHPAGNGLVVLGALTLYLDFINLFLLMLRARSRR